jgi:Type II secretion system (T2SS), protein E, N-terminal domain
MTFALARSLLLADAVTPEALGQALLLATTRGTSLVRALLATRAIDPMRLEQQLERGDAPYMRHVAPVMVLVQHLPPGLCERLLALPVRRDVRTGTVDVAVVDARDPHPVEEVAHWLAAPVRMVRTSLASMDAALLHLQDEPEHGLRTLAPPIWVPSPRQQPPAETEGMDFPVADPNIPFALTRKSLDSVPLLELTHPVEERDEAPETEPVLELRRRKSTGAIPAPNVRAPPNVPAPAPPLADLTAVLEAIQGASDRDSILELVVVGTRTVARKVAVLAVRRDALVGWTCSPELGERSALRAARVSPAMSDVFTGVLAADTARLARIPKDAAHAPLLSAMRAAPSTEVALVAVRVEGKAVALVLADELGDPLLAVRRMEELSRAAGDALGRLLRDRRKG